MIRQFRGPFETDATQSCLSGPVVVYMSGRFMLHQHISAFTVFVFPDGSITERAMDCHSRSSRHAGFESLIGWVDEEIHCKRVKFALYSLAL